MRFWFDILSEIFNMSITASIAFLAVLVLRLLLRNAPKRYAYMLWAIVLFRLLCPVSPASPFSVLNLVDAQPTDKGAITYIFAEHPSSEAPSVNLYPSARKQSQIEPADRSSYETLLSILTVIWLAGIVLLTAYSIQSALRLHRLVACSMKFRENIYLADHITSPFVLGLLQPKIYLPSTLQKAEREYIILHEQHHIRSRDYLIKPLAFAAVCLHWFNPVVWLAYDLFVQDMEMSCDEAVLEQQTRDIRAAYAFSLLHLAVDSKLIALTPLAFGEGDPKMRIKNILHYKKRAATTGVFTIIICVLGVVCFSTNPLAQEQANYEPMDWVQNLGTWQIADIELIAAGHPKNKQYKHFKEDEFADIAAFLQQCRGKYVNEPAIGSDSISFYITMKDGSRHQVSNIGNYYICIDDVSYLAGPTPYEWTSDWLKYYDKTDAKVPEGFER